MYVFLYIFFIYMTDPPPVYNSTISSSITPGDLSGFDIIISWTVSMLIDNSRLSKDIYFHYPYIYNGLYLKSGSSRISKNLIIVFQ